MLVPSLLLSAQRPAASVAPFVEPGLWYHCWVTRRARDRPHQGQNNRTSKRDTSSLSPLTFPVSSFLHKEPLAACTAVDGFSATDRHCTTVAAFCANGPAASVIPFVERGSDTTVGSLREPGGPSTSRLEQPHKQERWA